MSAFTFLTPLIYWLLIVMWTYILLFYIRRLRSDMVKGQLLFTLLIILAIDAFRTLFESVYFGAWYTSLAGFLPKEVHGFLVLPEMVFVPKFINVIAAAIVIGILLYRWLPQEEQAKDFLERMIKKRTSELSQSNTQLQKEISERKQAEIALMESETKYRSMMDSMKDLVYICSPDYQVEYMNPAMIRRTGRDATGEICFRVLHDLEDKCTWCMHGKIQQGEYCETDIISPKDNRSFNISSSPIKHEDGTVSKMTLYRDRTDIAKMKSLLQQAQKMEAIGTLAGGIAHDFNNLLFPIGGYTEMMLADITKDSPFRDSLDEILKATFRAKELVKQILTFSRQTEHVYEPLRVQLVVKEALKLIKASFPSTIKISRDIDGECGMVLADPTQIHQIVMNLCTNAYHAMEDSGGIMTVYLKEVEFAVEDLKYHPINPGKYVCLTIVDTGQGMDNNVAARIFDPYFTTKDNGKGTGLGLAVVHGIVKNHGGHITLYSEPGKGAEFHVYLPVIKARTGSEGWAAVAPLQDGNERILIVDDEGMVVQIEKQMLERLGYHVTVRTGSLEALEAFRVDSDNVDLVITDMTMPDMTGDQLALELLKIRPDIPIVLCTGFSTNISRMKAESMGIKGLLMKPILMSELSSTIRSVLDNR